MSQPKVSSAVSRFAAAAYAYVVEITSPAPDGVMITHTKRRMLDADQALSVEDRRFLNGEPGRLTTEPSGWPLPKGEHVEDEPRTNSSGQSMAICSCGWGSGWWRDDVAQTRRDFTEHMGDVIAGRV